MAAVGFVAAGWATVAGWDQWRLVVIGVAFFSLILTSLDYGVAYAGVVVNLGILAAMEIYPQL